MTVGDSWSGWGDRFRRTAAGKPPVKTVDVHTHFTVPRYDMGEPDPVGLIGRVERLDEGDAAAILGNTAAALLGLDG